jgi:hypothetical protein
MQWKRGEYQTFYAKMKIRIGGKEDIAIADGDEFQYDGTVLKYGGTEVNTIQLRGGIDNGWASSDQEDDSKPRAIIPTRNRAVAQSVNKDLSHVQRVSSTIETDNMDEDTVMNVSDRRPQASGRKVLNVPLDSSKPMVVQKTKAGLSITEKVRKTPGGMVITDEVEEQGGVDIGRVRTPTTITANMLDKTGAAAIQRLENIEGSGFIPHANTEGVSIKTSIGRAEEIDFGGGRVVGKVRHTDKDRGCAGDITVQDTSGPRMNRPKKTGNVQINTKVDPKVRIARAFDPDFPTDWSFTGKLAERLARVKEHGPTPQFLEALYAAEGDQMRTVLKKTFPKQFNG